jgi:hypothetical protein
MNYLASYDSVKALKNKVKSYITLWISFFYL